MKSMSNVDIFTITDELNNLLSGARVDKSMAAVSVRRPRGRSESSGPLMVGESPLPVPAPGPAARSPGAERAERLRLSVPAHGPRLLHRAPPRRAAGVRMLSAPVEEGEHGEDPAVALALREAQLVEDGADVLDHRALGQVQLLRDPAVRLPRRDVAQHLPLPRRQALQAVV